MCVCGARISLVVFGNIVVTLTKASTVCWPLSVVFKAISRVYGLFNLLNENARLHLTLARAAVAAALPTGRLLRGGFVQHGGSASYVGELWRAVRMLTMCAAPSFGQKIIDFVWMRTQ